MNYKDKIFAVAPMMDWTDRHCRFFHRQLSRHALLYTEMVVADAAIHGVRERLLGFSPQEQPLALQLGGSDPVKLAQAARIALGFGYSEINLNVGCPSDRVQSGTFGACLMRTPELVAQCVTAMKAVVDIPVTVKCRIGVDEQDVEVALDRLADMVFDAGCAALWVHARKAWLQGLSPKENRDVPSLDYDRVYRLKARLPHKFIGINGGIDSLNVAKKHLEHVDGVMVGRSAYHDPQMLLDIDSRIYGSIAGVRGIADVIGIMSDYADRHIASGGRLNHITRHMVGLFHGAPGARRFRQILSEDSCKPGAGSEVIKRAHEQIMITTTA